MLARQEVGTVYYFNLGEPFLPDNINEQISIIREYNPEIKIITSTNGVLLDTEKKLEAALMMDYVYISLDGVDQATVTRYQAGSNFEKAYRNMNNLLRMREERGTRRPIIEWKYVLFRWNDKPAQIDRAIDLARSAKVDVIAFYPGAAPIKCKTFRYYMHPYFQKLGEKTGQARTVNFHGIPREQLSP
jgi:MoaA/NifB/PqqE/SkfB family radical SAM enzyme